MPTKTPDDTLLSFAFAYIILYLKTSRPTQNLRLRSTDERRIVVVRLVKVALRWVGCDVEEEEEQEKAKKLDREVRLAYGIIRQLRLGDVSPSIVLEFVWVILGLIDVDEEDVEHDEDEEDDEENQEVEEMEEEEEEEDEVEEENEDVLRVDFRGWRWLWWGGNFEIPTDGRRRRLMDPRGREGDGRGRGVRDRWGRKRMPREIGGQRPGLEIKA